MSQPRRRSCSIINVPCAGPLLLIPELHSTVEYDHKYLLRQAETMPITRVLQAVIGQATGQHRELHDKHTIKAREMQTGAECWRDAPELEVLGFEASL